MEEIDLPIDETPDWLLRIAMYCATVTLEKHRKRVSEMGKIEDAYLSGFVTGYVSGFIQKSMDSTQDSQKQDLTPGEN